MLTVVVIYVIGNANRMRLVMKKLDEIEAKLETLSVRTSDKTDSEKA